MVSSRLQSPRIGTRTRWQKPAAPVPTAPTRPRLGLAALSELEALLRPCLGPMARIVVREAARRSRTLPEVVAAHRRPFDDRRSNARSSCARPASCPAWPAPTSATVGYPSGFGPSSGFESSRASGFGDSALPVARTAAHA